MGNLNKLYFYSFVNEIEAGIKPLVSVYLLKYSLGCSFIENLDSGVLDNLNSFIFFQT